MTHSRLAKMDWPKLDWPKLAKSGWPNKYWPKSVSSGEEERGRGEGASEQH